MNQVLETALENAGCVMHRRTSRIAFPGAILQMAWHICPAKSVKVVYVTQGTQVSSAAKVMGWVTALAFDPFLSRYNKS